tara:strand:+ start:138 stop:1073 length:936 start_codon:yes stop_codon:yes gene_type:complete
VSYFQYNVGKTNIVACLQGGGAATAWQAGALLPFIEHPDIHFSAITGTSGGALNGAILKHVFARHSQGEEGKARASSRLKDAWINHIAIDDLTANCVAFHSLINPVGHAMLAHANRGVFTRKLEQTLYTVLPDDEALKSSKGPAFYVQTVDENVQKGILYTGKDITRECILASAALKECFHSVNGQIDGAYLGGANPPSPAKRHVDKADHVMYFMTAAEPASVIPKKQCDLTAAELESDQIIREQAYCEIELLRQQGYPVTVIAPEKSFTDSEKSMTGRFTINRRINEGEISGTQTLHNILRYHHRYKIPA